MPAFKQSFAWWSFARNVASDDAPQLLAEAAAIGLQGVEMLPPELWATAREVGLEVVTLTGHAIETGFNHPDYRQVVTAQVDALVEQASANSIPYVIVFSGNRSQPELPDRQAIANCVSGLAPLASRAEQAGVTLILELLNSKVDHPGYQCDHSQFGFEVVRQVDSPALKVLFDIYHMQLMEGDISRTIKANLDAIGHIHTAGVPGRRDLDNHQELNWPAIAGLLDHIDYNRWVGHEFIPRADAISALRQAQQIFASASIKDQTS